MPRPPAPPRRLAAALLLLAAARLCQAQTQGCDGVEAVGGLPAQVLDAVNALRSAQGQPRLQPDAPLQAIACAHAQALAARGRLTHEGFAARFDASGRAHCVENLAAGHAQALPLLRAWQASPAHARNLVEPTVDRVAVARVGRMLVLLACSAGPAPDGAVTTLTGR